MSKCNIDYISQIINAIDDYFSENKDGNLENLELYVKEEVPRLEGDFSLDTYFVNSQEFKNQFNTVLKSYGLVLSSFVKDLDSKEVHTKSNITQNFSSGNIASLFHTLPLVRSNFERISTEKILNSIFIGSKDDINFVQNNSEITNNISKLKSELFEDIQKFLIKNNVLVGEVKPLYNSHYDVVDYAYYQRVMGLLDAYFFSGKIFKLIKTYSNKRGIPNLSLNTISNEEIFDAYNAGILLSNFDTVLAEQFSGIININYNLFNNLRSSIDKEDKYTLKIQGLKTEYWQNDSHEDEGSENSESKLVKLLVSTIPYLNKEGKDVGIQMEMKDFYLFAAMISDFETIYGVHLKHDKSLKFRYLNENPKEVLLWYLDEIEKAIQHKPNAIGPLENVFQKNFEFALSLKKYINSDKLNILEKEKNSKESLITMFAQIINNNFGASYSRYDFTGEYTINQMYSQNFNNIAVQNTTFNYLSKLVKSSRFEEKIYKKELSDILNAFNENDLSKINIKDKVNIVNYIKSKSGIKISYLGFDKLIQVLKPTSKKEFENWLISFTDKLGKDHSIIQALDDETTKNISGDASITKYMPNILDDAVYKTVTDAYLLNYIMKPVMNITTYDNKKLPTFKVATLTQKDSELFELQRNFELDNAKNTSFRSLLTKQYSLEKNTSQNNLFPCVILGTGTKLELTNEDGGKSATKFNVSENFTSDFQFDFLQNILDNNRFSIMLGNYSDKNTILTKIINGLIKLDGNTPLIQMPVTKILKYVQDQGQTYYKDTLFKVFDDYEKLLGIKLSMKTVPEENIKKINEALNKINVRSLSQKASQLGINLTEELHYSKYFIKDETTGKFKQIYGLNQLLVDNFRIFNNPKLFGEFVKLQEENMINKFKEFNKNVNGGKEITFAGSPKFEEIIKKLGISKEEFTKKGTETNYRDLLGANGINPLLKKWMWLNALMRNEYMFISAKGEYMHPHKLKENLLYRGDSKEVNWVDYEKEMSGRMISMAKRNVLYTATIEVPVRKSAMGIPENVNMAAIDDHQDMLYNLSGDTHKQDVHDGSTFIPYIYNLMLDNSFPAKGYEGTKKQFGSLITKHGVVVKKDAESEINNANILNSRRSNINFYNKQKQVLGSILIKDLKFSFEQSLDDFYYNHLGDLFKINKLTIKNNSYEMIVSKKVNNQWLLEPNIIRGNFETLFDLWKLFGAQHSTNEHGDFNEGSNDLLYKLITTKDNSGAYSLKDKMIHIISNLSALKAGGTNVNSKDSWTNDKNLAYFTFENRMMGPQLDATHEANESQIKEVTQVISALAQNASTSYLALEAYQNIANVIENAMRPYLKYLANSENINNSDLYKYLSDKFVKTISNSKGDTIAKILVESFKDDVNIPFSNQNFFVAFVRDVITRMNNEFITRYYSGTGAVLIPSHGIIQLYDIPQADGTTRIVTQGDLAKEALNNYDKTLGLTTNDDIITNYISNLLQPLPTTWDKIQLGDTIQLEMTPELQAEIEVEQEKLGEAWDYMTAEQSKDMMNSIVDRVMIKTLFNPGLYYKYKGTKTSEPITKIINKPRDLKPSEITYVVNGIQKNVFDFDSVRLRYKLNEIIDDLKNRKVIDQTSTDYIILSNFFKDFTGFDLFISLTTKLEETAKLLNTLLNKWTQRNLELLETNRVMNPVDITTKFNNKVGLFKTDNFNAIFSDVQQLYDDSNSSLITNYKFNAAELILGDIYQSKFNRNFEDSMYEIKQQGSAYFEKLLEKDFHDDSTVADIKLYLNNYDSPIYVKYTDNLPGNDYSLNITLEHPMEEDGVNQRFVRRNQKGEILYTIPDTKNVSIRMENGKEVIYIKAVASFKLGKETHTNKVKDFDQNLKDLIKSFKGNIRSFIPLMNNKFDLFEEVEDTETAAKIAERKTEKVAAPSFKSRRISFNSLTLQEFSKFSGYSIGDKSIKDKWFLLNKNSIISQLGKKMYASWEKSHEFVAARIPSQSMQSFMEMKNVAYLKTKSNDAYVSIWQIWLQGSDFDIDKAYILGSSFSGNGQFNTWGSIDNYSSIEQLHELEKLPLPNATIVELVEGGLDLTEDFIKFYANPSLAFNEFSAEQLKVLNTILRKINNVNVKQLSEKNHPPITTGISINGNEELLKGFVVILNNFNKNKKHLYNNESLKNLTASTIKQVISSPSNYLLANTPINIDDWHQAAKEALSKKTKPPTILSMYDMFSMYKQQRDAAVGKDDVGIAANGLKAFFALSTYYNSYFNNFFENKADALRQSNKTFSKQFNFINNGVVTPYKLGMIADVNIQQKQITSLQKSIGDFELRRTNAALALSGFTSAATDNAKELLMAKINANVELASMHIYLMILGFTPTQVANIMTNDVMEDVIDALEVNAFFNPKKPVVATIFTKLIKEYGDENPEKVQNAKTLKEIFQGAQEVKVLAKFLSVNQKTSANIQEINKYLSNFETAVYARENHVFSNNVADLNFWMNNKDSKDLVKVAEANTKLDKLIGLIFKYNTSLDASLDVAYVKKTLLKAGQLNIIGGNFDFQIYFKPENVLYREATKEYYNLIKSTFNIFDVIDDLPHFREMINGLALTHEILLKSSVKYNTAFSLIKTTIRENSHRIVSNSSNIVNQFGNPSFYPKITDNIISKGLAGIDIRLISEWLKTDELKKYSFNVTELLRKVNSMNFDAGLTKINNFRVYTSDNARNAKYINDNSILVNETDTENTIITLDTNFGIANFKRLMESILLPMLQTKSNILLDSLKVQTNIRNILGIKTQGITSTFPLSAINNAVTKDKAQKLIKAFNELDISHDTNTLVKNTQNNLVKWRDLFYIYNLTLNNERYGALRLTPLFEDYIKEEDSLGYDYVMFSSKIDSGELNLYDLEKELSRDPEYLLAQRNEDKLKILELRKKIKTELENDLLFYSLHKQGSLAIKGLGSELNSSNGDFVIVTSMTETPEVKKGWAELHEVIQLIKSKGFIIKFEC